MSFNLANMSFQERAQIEAEKARLFDYWQNNLGKAKGEAGRLIAEKAAAQGQVGGVGTGRARRHVAA